MTAKIDWLHKKKLTKQEVIDCKEVIGELLERSGWVHGKTLALVCQTTPIDIRKRIQNIRENNDMFFSKTNGYIIATRKGYLISFNKKEIKNFIKKTHLVAQSKLQQVEQGYKAIGAKGW